MKTVVGVYEHISQGSPRIEDRIELLSRVREGLIRSDIAAVINVKALIGDALNAGMLLDWPREEALFIVETVLKDGEPGRFMEEFMDISVYRERLLLD